MKRVHPNLQLTRIITARLATRGYPWLGLSKHSEEGRKIRGCVRALPGWSLQEEDYSQIELRAAAHMSGDESMINVYKTGGDIHANTGLAVFGVPKEQQDESLHRLPSKTGNFSMLMGTSPKGLTESMHKALADVNERKRAEGQPQIPVTWSKGCPGCLSFKAEHLPSCDSVKFMTGWFKGYPGIRAFMDERREKGAETGYATGMWGEYWYLPGVWSPHEDVREATLRQMHALPVQSGAQRLIKKAMRVVKERDLPWANKRRVQAEIVLQVHDSMLFHVRTEFVPEWHSRVKATMEGIAQWQVPIVAEGKAGPSWLEQSKLS